MTRGIYQAAAQLQSIQLALANTAHNLANASTPGFQRSIASFRAALASTASPRGADPAPADGGPALLPQLTLASDRSGGALDATADPLDLALHGPGYLAVETPQGVRYTRGGHLERGPEGELRLHGALLLGDNGPLRLADPGAPFVVDTSGRVAQNGASAGRLRLVDLPLEGPKREGAGLWNPGDPQAVAPAPAELQVRQGYREQSNVNVIDELVGMIALQRSYESTSRAIQAQSQSTDRLIQDR